MSARKNAKKRTRNRGSHENDAVRFEMKDGNRRVGRNRRSTTQNRKMQSASDSHNKKHNRKQEKNQDKKRDLHTSTKECSSRYVTVKGNFLEGKHALQEAYEAGIPISVVYVSDAASKDASIMQLLNVFKADGAEIVRAKKAQLDARSSHGAHQGIVAKLAPFSYAHLYDLIDAAKDKKNALIIACDHIVDAGNFGAICRSAEIVGACGVLIPDKRCAQVTAATYKTSAGAIVHLPIAQETNLVRSLETLKEEGFWIVGASEHAQQLLWDSELSGRIVLVMGSEEKGLSRLVQETCDMLVALPQVGRIESLNVAQACTCLAYEWLRQSR